MVERSVGYRTWFDSSRLFACVFSICHLVEETGVLACNHVKSAIKHVYTTVYVIHACGLKRWVRSWEILAGIQSSEHAEQ